MNHRSHSNSEPSESESDSIRSHSSEDEDLQQQQQHQQQHPQHPQQLVAANPTRATKTPTLTISGAGGGGGGGGGVASPAPAAANKLMVSRNQHPNVVGRNQIMSPSRSPIRSPMRSPRRSVDSSKKTAHHMSNNASILPVNKPGSASLSASHSSSVSRSLPLTREQLQQTNRTALKSGEVEVLYRSPEPTSPLDRHLKEEQAKQVAPNKKQSPIAIMSMNPTYELQNKPLILEYPATVENLRLNNTGFSWEVKMPYQISMTTALYGAHLNTMHRYRLDQFHCHWGEQDNQGSEHTVDNHSYSAELHFVHYNMEKYHTFSKAARHPDGLVVMSVFVDAREDYHNHAELEKIVAHLKSVQSKGDHSIIKQAIRIENLLPANRSYWSYQGSLTTPPYLESVTWFVLKHPIKCNRAQLQKFRGLKSSLSHDGEGVLIKSNHRKTQPLNGRTIVMYNEPR